MAHLFIRNKKKVAALLRESGMSQLSPQEVDARETAQMLIDLNRQAEETGIDKILYFAVDEISKRDYPLIDRFLKELGSALRLGEDEIMGKSDDQQAGK